MGELAGSLGKPVKPKRAPKLESFSEGNIFRVLGDPQKAFTLGRGEKLPPAKGRFYAGGLPTGEQTFNRGGAVLKQFFAAEVAQHTGVGGSLRHNHAAS